MRDDVADLHTSRSLFLPPLFCLSHSRHAPCVWRTSKWKTSWECCHANMPSTGSEYNYQSFSLLFFFFPRRSCLSWPSSTMNGEHFDCSRRRSSCLPALTFTNERGGGNSHSFACSQLMEAVIWRRKACPHVRILAVLRTIAHPFPTVVSNTKSIVGNRRWFQVFTQEKYIRNWGFFLWSFSRSIGNNAL